MGQRLHRTGIAFEFNVQFAEVTRVMCLVFLNIEGRLQYERRNNDVIYTYI